MCSRGTLNDLPDGRPAELSAATRPVARLPLLSRLFLSVREFVEFSSEELIKKAIDALDHEIDIPKLTYTVKTAMQTAGNAFAAGTRFGKISASMSGAVQSAVTAAGLGCVAALALALVPGIPSGTVRYAVRDDMGMQDAKLLDRRSFAAGGGK